MGSAQSHHSPSSLFGPSYTQMEGSRPELPQEIPTNGLAQRGDAPPAMPRVESFSDKFIRKFSSQPLVPIGCVATAYFLVSGIKSFKDRDPVRSQKMMRARVGAQFVTIVIFMGYLGWEQVDFRLAPAYQDKKKRELEMAGGGGDASSKQQ